MGGPNQRWRLRGILFPPRPGGVSPARSVRVELALRRVTPSPPAVGLGEITRVNRADEGVILRSGEEEAGGASGDFPLSLSLGHLVFERELGQRSTRGSGEGGRRNSRG